jgi:DNA repair exonuclease SbcCD ATPase subunit/DNA repair exonuclease SbcCD nuclease subunit
MTKIAHLADTHILNTKRHDEFKEVFAKIYEILRDEKVDYIVHCGDIAHTKTQISPEFVEMASDFFKNLADIAPTYIILGNHDTNLKNDTRQDAISPIIKALNLPNLHLQKYSGEISVNNNISFNVLSRLDENNWKKPTDLSKINIALYHGAISGVQTDTGYTLENGEHNINALEGHDFAFLGDIHKSNQLVDTDGRVRYPGSTIQGSFGELDDKGFLIWSIESKDKFDCKHYIIPNPRPFITIELDEEGNLPNILLKEGSKVRVMANKSVSLDKSKKAIEIIKNKFNPESVTFVSKTKKLGIDTSDASNVATNLQNLRDLSVQEKLIRDFLKDYKTEEEVIQKVLELNKKYNSSVEEDDDIYRNVKWKLKSLEWDNLFNYGEGNKINFENLNGIVGIFGKNYSGKSSVVDSILYTIYNTTSKNNRKNLNIINQTKDKGLGKVEVEINGENYIIDRTSEKYTKKLKGVETVEAKTEVEFTSDAGSLNGLARNDTDKIIRKYFGTVDDFFLTSMASQFGYLSFIGEGSTNRKQILAKFLDLESFEKKFKLAKEDSAEIKALVKRLETNNNYDDLIKQAEINLSTSKLDAEDKSYLIKELLSNSVKINEELQKISDSLKNIPTEIIDYNSTIESIARLKLALQTFKDENISYEEEKKKLHGVIDKTNEFLSMIDGDQLQKDDQELNNLNKKIVPLEREIAALSTQLKNAKHKLELLESVPCGDSFPSCKFIKDAFEYRNLYPSLNTEHEQKNNQLNELNGKYDELDQKLADLLNKKNKITQKKLESEKALSTIQISIERNNLSIEKRVKQIEEYEQKAKTYEENKEAIENYIVLQEKKKKLQQNIKEIGEKIEYARHEMNVANVSYGSYLKEIETLKQQKLDLQKLRNEYAAFDLYQKCMHPSGISYEIIKQKLPEINAEIAKILSNIVNFSIFLENDDDKLDIMIKHPNFEPRPLEMGSGAEKTLASTAIRLALINVTSLPVSDIFILDEPGTALDQENLDGFVRILELIKSYFKTVILISHLDYLKDCVDTQITIDKKDGYAYINQ